MRSGRRAEVSEDVELDYNELFQEAQKKAYRLLMQEVLEIVAELGDAPGEHHFFIEFVTGAPGVVMPDHLKEQYPERMTIVLQHQFEDLTVTDDQMAVTLWFKGKESRLEIPFSAITQFADPSAQFGVSFDAPEPGGAAAKPGTEPAAPSEEGEDEDAPAAKKGDGADIVSLDSFRKK